MTFIPHSTMTNEHRATPEQWAAQKAWAVDDASSSCLLELRARIEQLEAASASLPSEEEQDYEAYITERERWKPIAGYEGYYMISSLGRIRSEDRTIPHQRTGSRFIQGKILKTGLKPNGYTMIVLRKENRKETRTIHTLVAEAFLGPRPEGMLVCHGSGGKQDNRLENLYYGSPEQNNGPDKQRDGTLLAGERNHGTSLRDEDVIAIRSSNAKGVTLAGLYGVSEQCISDIRNHRRWTHLPSVEALEAAQRPRPAPAEVRFDGVEWKNGETYIVSEAIIEPSGSDSLVESIEARDGGDGRTALRVVAAWMQERTGTIANGSQWAEMLRDEADR